VKAQQVKNAVIVPVGSKGGFYPKQMPRGGARRGPGRGGARLQDLPVGPAGHHRQPRRRRQDRPPAGVIVHDGDDPYLVVAADKGTATFSDIANGVAEDYGFWLGDAFASGGSAGYDHKGMGITARGAWEAVKRHFRELGKDIQTEPFTASASATCRATCSATACCCPSRPAGGGLRPPPHLPRSRSRPAKSLKPSASAMFALPRSSWDDYDKSLISKGGGVFARSLKRSRCRRRSGRCSASRPRSRDPVPADDRDPQGRAELLYFGGIGTYVKARTRARPTPATRPTTPCASTAPTCG
jgi:glutamate dehydrogenase